MFFLEYASSREIIQRALEADDFLHSLFSGIGMFNL